MNQIHIIGRLTENPELRTTSGGTTVCKLRLAVDGMGRGSRDAVGYINVSSFGGGGEAAAKKLKKGWLVAVEGRLEYGEWENDAGEKRHSYEVIGNVEFLTAPRPKDEQAAGEPAEEVQIAA